MNWCSRNFEIWELFCPWYQILIRRQPQPDSFRVFLVKDWFDINTHINTVKDGIPFIWFTIEAWKLCLDGIYIPASARKSWIADILLTILDNIANLIEIPYWITSYINKPLLSHKLIQSWYKAIQDDIAVEICDFWTIPEVKFVQWKIEEVLEHVDMKWKLHPPFYRISWSGAKWSWIVVPIHTRFEPPDSWKLHIKPVITRVKLSRDMIWKCLQWRF